ncbi:hypothetical protein ACFVUW_00620 [Streptomyces xiamenensis]|uniref:hypothetical protein n=1 Tax=Streptomyces xiamenensis TaxID=408015 RepID=UPI0036E5A3C9
MQELYLTDNGRWELVGAGRLLVDLDEHLRDSLGEEDYQRLCTLLGDLMTHLHRRTPRPDRPAPDRQRRSTVAPGTPRSTLAEPTGRYRGFPSCLAWRRPRT